MYANRITIVGNVTRNPELRQSPTGVPVTDLVVAENYRRLEGEGENREWRDVATTFYTVDCWRGLAANVARSVGKGHPVVVTGRLYLQEWTDQDGVTRKKARIEAETVGFDLQYASVIPLPRLSSIAGRDVQVSSLAAAPADRPAGAATTGADPFDADAQERSDPYRTPTAVPASEA